MNPVKEYKSATIWFVDDIESGVTVRSENVHLEVYPNWVDVDGTQLIPRERVEKVSTI